MNQYVKALFRCLSNVEFSNEENRIHRYQDGIDDLVSGFCEKKSAGATIFFIGNGGSAAIASHMTADFMKNGGFNTCSLYDSAVITCMGNDYGYENVFSKQIEALAQKNDLLVAISSSGESMNIVNAINSMRQRNANVYTFTGFKDNNTIKGMGDKNVYVPSEKYGIVESIHNIILQEIVDVVAERIQNKEA